MAQSATVMILTLRNRKCITYCLAVLVVTWILLYTTLLQSRPLPDLNKEYSLSNPIINPYNFTFLINSERCDSDVQLLIVVHSSTKVSRSSTFSAFFLSLNGCGYISIKVRNSQVLSHMICTFDLIVAQYLVQALN